MPIRRGGTASGVWHACPRVAALCVVATPPRCRTRNQGPDHQRHGPNLPGILVHDAAMREALAKSTHAPLPFLSEALDAHRFAFSRLRAEFFDPAAQKVQRRDVRCRSFRCRNRRSISYAGTEPIVAGRLGLLLRRAATGNSRHRVRGAYGGVLTRRTVDKTVELGAQASARRATRPRRLRSTRAPRRRRGGAPAAASRRPAGGGICVWVAAAGTASTRGTRASRHDRRVSRQSRDREGRPYVPRNVLHAIAQRRPHRSMAPTKRIFGTGIVAESWNSTPTAGVCRRAADPAGGRRRRSRSCPRLPTFARLMHARCAMVPG